MTTFQTLALLLTFAALGAYINHRYLKLPATVGLMLVSLLLSLAMLGLNWLGVINLNPGQRLHYADPDFFRALPARHAVVPAFCRRFAYRSQRIAEIPDPRRQYSSTVGVVLATFVTGGLIWRSAKAVLGLSFPYIEALLFGALIAPTDPDAVLGILKSTSIAKNLRFKNASEACSTTASASWSFSLCWKSPNGDSNLPKTPEHISCCLVWGGLGSVILGLTLGWITYRMLRSASTITRSRCCSRWRSWCNGFSVAEAIGMSAPITMVVAGLLIGNPRPGFRRVGKRPASISICSGSFSTKSSTRCYSYS